VKINKIGKKVKKSKKEQKSDPISGKNFYLTALECISTPKKSLKIFLSHLNSS
jgi:hypothetical protein